MHTKIGWNAELCNHTAAPEMPPVVTAYLLRMLKPKYPAMGTRNERELATTAAILDALAQKQPGKAADIAAQRFKALSLGLENNTN